MLINDSRVKVKVAFESQEATWTFNQILDPADYDYLCCLGMHPNSDGEIDGKCFVFHSREVEHLINTEVFHSSILVEKHGIGLYHQEKCRIATSGKELSLRQLRYWREILYLSGGEFSH